MCGENAKKVEDEAMTRRMGRILAAALLALILCVILPACSNPADNTNTFSCATRDPDGRVLQGYWSEKDGVWYLFVTATMDIREVTVYYTGQITGVSAGKPDLENKQVSQAFSQNRDKLTLVEENGTAHTVVVLQSQLPSVYIDLEGTTLAQIHEDKEVKYAGNGISIQDPQGRYNLTVKKGMQIKGRGNSSWKEYQKKGYQIRFDSKLSLLGMEKAKKWVLLANASDDTMMRNKLVFDMAANWDMAFVPKFEYVDLWIEGEYLGTYLLGEKVELTQSRLNLKKNTGTIFEHDEAFYQEEPYQFVSKLMGKHFVVKESNIENEALIQTAMATFETRLDDFVQYLYSTPAQQITLEDLSSWIDVDSFANYYLINEYTMNCEAYATSFYWYMDGDGDVLHVGPVWDFDTCMGVDGRKNTENYGSQHILFRYLLAIPAFHEHTQQLYAQHCEDLASMTGAVDHLQGRIESSARMNYARWDTLGKVNPKSSVPFAPTFQVAVDSLRTWLAGREEYFQVERCSTVSSVVSPDCTQMTVTYDDNAVHDSMVFAVWSKENGDDDLQWYAAQRDSNGSWASTVSLRNHNCAGMYYIVAYAGEQMQEVAVGRNYAQEAREPLYVLSGTIHQTSQTLTLTMTDLDPALTGVRFGVWGTEAGQEKTMLQLEAKKTGDGYWTAETNACQFRLGMPDSVTVHAYGTTATGEGFLGGITVPVTAAVLHALPADGSMICTRCGKAVDHSEVEALSTPVWRLLNPNTNEHFFTGSMDERDTLVGYGWIDEGVAWYVPVYFGTPVYRLMNPNNGDRIYTLFEDEIGTLTQAGWQVEGVSWNSAREGVEVYRLYNPALELGSHFYTVSKTERDVLLSQGWVLEGIAWYGMNIENAGKVG